ncbi:IclR family transcriptional regulator [Kitasatospora herbaricolor]|uniref:Helix-turn-helix domain-containing protein n=1 Tax=Kitasatospora herbaricolor TaxID=68217 RepID=A0ABZ1WA42_9ACTN|nr:helix-turn-helix domain-containing protein [Kitasatospora herbaricolor]
MDRIAETSNAVRRGRPARASTTRPAGKKDRQPTLIASVQRALRLLEAVGSFLQGATAKQLARAAGLPLGTTYHLLRTLTHEGYLRRVDGRFYYGDSVEGISRADGRQAGRTELRTRMERLRDELGAAVYLAVYEEGEVQVVDVASGPNQPAVEVWADLRATAHAHAIGQCLLGQLSEEARRDHLARHPPVGLTPSTPAREAAVLRVLGAISPTVPVVERQQYALGTVCAAVPITVGSLVATMALSLPLEQADRLAAAAEQLRVKVGAMSPSFVL